MRRGVFPVALVIVLLLLAGAAVLGIGWYARPKPIAVKTAVAQQAASVQDRTLLNASGYVSARRAATVSAKITGRVTEVMVEEGMKVEAGQVLAKLDASNLEKFLNLSNAQLESARKALGETQASLEQAERELKRLTGMTAEKVASQNEFDAADAQAKSLRARLDRQQADVIVAEREVAQRAQDLDDTIIRAPFGGIVTSKDAQPGETISPMSSGGFTRTGICTIVDMSSLEIEVDVSESYINRVEPSQPVVATLDAYPQWKIPAHVIAIIPTADRQKATVKVRVGFEKLDPRILPEMSVKVAFQQSAAPTTAETNASQQRMVIVPKSALAQRDGKDIVWIVRDSKAQRRAVSVADVVGDNANISAGVEPGDRIVIEGSADVSDGASVTESK